MISLIDKIKIGVDSGVKEVIELDNKVIFYFKNSTSVYLYKENSDSNLIPRIVNNKWYIGEIPTNFPSEDKNKPDENPPEEIITDRNESFLSKLFNNFITNNIDKLKGNKGDKGDKGNDGINGNDGKSAYEIAKENGYTGTDEDFALLISNLMTEEKVNNTVNKLLSENDLLSKKKIYCFGDSLMVSRYAIDNNLIDSTYGWKGGYPQLIRNQHADAIVYNFGVPNGHLCPSSTAMMGSVAFIPDVIKEKLSEKTENDIDYIILNGCGNDIYATVVNGGTPSSIFGSVSSSVPTNADNSKICGSLEIIFYWLVNKFPKTKIIYIGLPPIKQFYSVPNLYNETIESNLNELLRKVCETYGVTFVDLTKSILRRDLNFDSGFFYKNDVHIAQAGYEAISDIINKAI